MLTNPKHALPQTFIPQSCKHAIKTITIIVLLIHSYSEATEIDIGLKYHNRFIHVRTSNVQVITCAAFLQLAMQPPKYFGFCAIAKA